jgi:hypothetical protein
MNFRLHHLNSSFKWAISAYVFLVALGFCVAGLQSYDRYRLSPEKTREYYLGNPAEGEMAFPKPYGHLISITHIHSYTMPLVFLTVWIGLQWVPLRSAWKKTAVVGGALSILLYNAAPYLLRYLFPRSVFLFPAGGTGLFLFFFWPAGAILYETWFGFPPKEEPYLDI